MRLFARILAGSIAALSLSLAVPADARVIILPPHPPGDYVWVPPVYQTITEKVWVADRVERIPTTYWVSATYGWRTICYRDEFGVLVERREWGEIAPGHWETSYREVVVEGHYETRTRQVLLAPGHWEYVGPTPPPPIMYPLPHPPHGPIAVGQGDAEWEKDKGKFSPLYEWPK